MSLSNEEAELLGDWWDDGTESDLTWDLSTLIPVVARIKQAALAAALTEAADWLPSATEGPKRVGTAPWSDIARDAYSLAIEEAQTAIRSRIT